VVAVVEHPERLVRSSADRGDQSLVRVEASWNGRLPALGPSFIRRSHACRSIVYRSSSVSYPFGGGRPRRKGRKRADDDALRQQTRARPVNADVETRRLSAAPDPPVCSSRLEAVVVPRRLRLLLEVDRLGSITRAAEACSVGQPTASADLRALEAAVGRPLCERSGRATRLTEAGRLLSAQVATVISMVEGLEQQMTALDTGLAGTLRIAACDGFGAYVVPSVLAELARERPGIEIETRIAPSGEVVRLVTQGLVQLGIAGATRRPAGGLQEPLTHDELVWIASADRSPASASLSGLTLVLPRGESSTRALVERSLSRAGCRPGRILEVDSVEGVKRAVRAGAGVAAVSRIAAADELTSGAVTRFTPLPMMRMTREIQLVRAEHRRATPLERAFEHSLRAHCRGIAAKASGFAMPGIASSA
jgi:molybdate transport repressor ModE-like protein